jgi:hypothetical protein
VARHDEGQATGRTPACSIAPRTTSSEVPIDPRWLFPLLAAVFAVSTLVRMLRSRRLDPAARTWALLAVAFGAVSAWLHWVAR